MAHKRHEVPCAQNLDVEIEEGEKEEKEKATSGLSEAPSRSTGSWSSPLAGGGKQRVLAQALAGPRKAEGKVVGVQKKQINRLAKAIIIKRKSH